MVWPGVECQIACATNFAHETYVTRVEVRENDKVYEFSQTFMSVRITL